jgi:hypothetical protein
MMTPSAKTSYFMVNYFLPLIISGAQYGTVNPGLYPWSHTNGW